MRNNPQLAALFYELADLLDILDVEWKPMAFRKAARNIEALSKDVADIYEKGGLDALEKIPGVGQRIAEKTEEFLKTGTINELVRTRKKLPKGLARLMNLRGIGPKSVKVLYKKLRINSVKDLEYAAKKGRIAKLSGFGIKSQTEILDAIGFARKGSERMLLGNALPIARDIESALKKVKGVQNVMIGGSVRRRKETCKDVDILVIAKDSKAVMDAFTAMSNVTKVTGKGKTKSSVMLAEGLPADLRVVPAKSFGGAVQYFSGSKEHNIRLRQLALKKGYTLNEYGLFTVKSKKYVCGRSEREIYRRIGVPYVPPELRENSGEFVVKKIPALLPYRSIKGDLQMHTTWSDGSTSIKDMVDACKKIGHKYVAITDHSKHEFQANGMDEKRLLKYLKEVREVDKMTKGIKVLAGAEVDILGNGTLDYSGKYLKQLDVVVASVHSGFKQDRKKMTKRIIQALENPYVSILGHPTGRLINKRPGIVFDEEVVFQAAKENNVLLEINSQPARLDLNAVMARRAKEMGCKFVISTDAHHPDQLQHAELGEATARRGWCEKKHIANTLPWTRFRRFLKGF